MTHFGGPFRDFLFTVLELQQPLGRPHGRFRMFSWAVVMKLATGIDIRLDLCQKRDQLVFAERAHHCQS